MLNPNSSEYVFRRLKNSKDGLVLDGANVPLSYGRAREELGCFLKDAGYEPRRFSWHSLRHGGATAAAKVGIPDRLFKKHGRWRSEGAKDGYVHESLTESLSVSKALGL